MSLNTWDIMYRLEYHAIILTIRGKKSDKINQNIKKVYKLLPHSTMIHQNSSEIYDKKSISKQKT